MTTNKTQGKKKLNSRQIHELDSVYKKEFKRLVGEGNTDAFSHFMADIAWLRAYNAITENDDE